MASTAPNGEQKTVNSATNGAPPQTQESKPKATTALATIEPMASPNGDGTIAPFSSHHVFDTAQRMAKALAEATMMPTAYQKNLPNCLIALEMASRIGASVLMVAQNLDIIHGKPSFSAKFLIATVNASKRFTPLRFRFEGPIGKDDWGCRAVATDLDSKEELTGPLVSIRMAKEEGWYSKNGSKWKTMPELMLIYRSAAFWTRVYCPELSLGISTQEEVIDTHGYTVTETKRAPATTGNAKDLEAELMAEPVTPTKVQVVTATPVQKTEQRNDEIPPAPESNPSQSTMFDEKPA